MIRVEGKMKEVMQEGMSLGTIPTHGLFLFHFCFLVMR